MTFARIRAIVIVSVLVVAAMIVVAAAILRDNETGPVGAGCPKDAVIADTRLPEPSEVKINVYNASERPGLANQVKTDFVNRKFTVVNAGNDPKGKRLDQVPLVRRGCFGRTSWTRRPGSSTSTARTTSSTSCSAPSSASSPR